MKKNPLVAALVASLIFSAGFCNFSSIARADEPVATASALASAPQPGPAPRGDDQGRPRHHIDEDRESGIEGIQLIFVGAAIVIALGLAYRAGRRRRAE